MTVVFFEPDTWPELPLYIMEFLLQVFCLFFFWNKILTVTKKKIPIFFHQTFYLSVKNQLR